jgi:tRNA(Ile2) C34 agmatinyltransferase TiaS
MMAIELARRYYTHRRWKVSESQRAEFLSDFQRWLVIKGRDGSAGWQKITNVSPRSAIQHKANAIALDNLRSEKNKTKRKAFLTELISDRKEAIYRKSNGFENIAWCPVCKKRMIVVGRGRFKCQDVYCVGRVVE